MKAIIRLQSEIPFVFPVHPPRRAIDEFVREPLPNLIFTEPLGYFDFMKLIGDARFVLTDSGGVQEETTYLGVPCLTMRENTERPVTVTQGTNQLVGLDPQTIITEGLRALDSVGMRHVVPELWDGERRREFSINGFARGKSNRKRGTGMSVLRSSGRRVRD